VLEPIYERTFIADSYACRKGKGTHAAVERCQQFGRRFRYVLKADIQKFVPSLDHARHRRKSVREDVVYMLVKLTGWSGSGKAYAPVPGLEKVGGGGFDTPTRYNCASPNPPNSAALPFRTRAVTALGELVVSLTGAGRPAGHRSI
jgi:hypothetical protein